MTAARATAAQLAGLPEMPADKSGVIRRAAQLGWSYIEEPGRGGTRRLYDVGQLPAATISFNTAPGVSLGNAGSGASWKQGLWVGCAMSPMSSVSLLLVSQYVAASVPIGGQVAMVALPAILLMEMLGAVLATLALYRAGECSKPWSPVVRGASTGPVHES